ncbi:methyltransferase domain-containing protein [Tessaracoccus coleopterorum]|uniref:hypothetical protein n=1 Tax=Tessaracoccus coleopterorum TaxID=2714950 RepID=UPI0018D2C020|nr:hypothetical protein [Tessaracoccus coleopterorum]
MKKDLTHLQLPERFDLVTASFLHSPVALDRTAILRRAASYVREGGHLLVTAHAAPPPWANDEHRATFKDVSPEQEIADLDLVPGSGRPSSPRSGAARRSAPTATRRSWTTRWCCCAGERRAGRVRWCVATPVPRDEGRAGWTATPSVR